jgi:hypothetical protein
VPERRFRKGIRRDGRGRIWASSRDSEETQHGSKPSTSIHGHEDGQDSDRLSWTRGQEG